MCSDRPKTTAKSDSVDRTTASAAMAIILASVAALFYGAERGGALWFIVFVLALLVSGMAVALKKTEGGLDGLAEEMRKVREENKNVRRITPEEYEKVIKETSERVVERKLN